MELTRFDFRVTGTAETELSEAEIRTLGSVQLALVSGLMMQHLTDPESAPTADEVRAGLRGAGTPRRVQPPPTSWSGMPAPSSRRTGRTADRPLSGTRSLRAGWV